MDPRYPVPTNVCFPVNVRSPPGRTLVRMSSGVGLPPPASPGLSSWVIPRDTVGVNTQPGVIRGAPSSVDCATAGESAAPVSRATHAITVIIFEHFVMAVSSRHHDRVAGLEQHGVSIALDG